ncbi:MAG: glycosyltransferase family 9 protein [Campylobacterota bacterium]|nr:glycosyltransferase family 9 protein [Campylobacterota bacterium]
MRIVIELPSWLGDAVMATPSIENLLELYPDAKLTLVGSHLSTQALKSHPRVVESVVLDKRFRQLYRTAKRLGSFDMAISFRSSFRSGLFLFFIDAKERYQFPKSYSGMHQVEKYALFIEESLGIRTKPERLKLYERVYSYPRPTLGINPGASYGSAKRWYPESFADVAISLASRYDIVIFGGPGEEEIARDIEEMIRKSDIDNVENLAGELTIPELISRIAGLSWLVTNDSGPMHVAAAYQIPTVALFGPTKYRETNQWQNPKGYLIRKEMECSPCMKRSCPLKHHNCMREILADDVLEVINRVDEVEQ